MSKSRKKQPPAARKRLVFCPKALSLLLAAALCGNVYADGGKTAKTAPSGNGTELKGISVKGSKRTRTHRREKDITGLGKVIKTSETLDKQQVIDIRDLVRYDPGVAVVEQGRGASSGYSMRGVDKNRVATTVDGIAQIQSYTVQGNRPGSGAINEIEYENIASVEISKGASSSEYGSGSLGGAVGFRTKEADDLIEDGRNWGVRSKTAYSSKNRQLLNSLGAAFRLGGFEGLAQYTARRGEAARPHTDATKGTVYEFRRLGGFVSAYNLQQPDDDGGFKRNSTYFILADECADPVKLTGCAEPRATAQVTNDKLTTGSLLPSELTDKQKELFAKTRSVTERVSPKEYTGEGRVLPDPLQYRTGSWLLRGGYSFSPKHSINAVFEHTKQRYDTRDMTVPAYYPYDMDRKGWDKAFGVYDKGQNILDSLYLVKFKDEESTDGGISKAPEIDNAVGLKWTRAEYTDERHKKQRWGIHYRYQNPAKNGVIDTAQIGFDRQSINIDNLLHGRNCSVYPHADRNCQVSTDKPWSHVNFESNRYREQHNLFRMEASKDLRWGISRHRLSATAGIDRFQSVLNRDSLGRVFSTQEYESVAAPDGKHRNGEYDKPAIYRKKAPQIVRWDGCKENLSSYYACGERLITGNNLFFGLRNNMSFGQYVDLGLGVRYDRHTFRSDDQWTGKGNYRNWSWNTGLVVKPTANIALSYRASSGYRVPSFQELFGYRLPGNRVGEDNKFHRPTKVSPEKSLNHEWGLTLRGAAGTLELTQFDNRYKGLIARGTRYYPVKFNDDVVRNHPFQNYYNVQDVRLGGTNIAARLEGNGIWDKIPDGLYATAAYNRIKPKSVSNRAGFSGVQSYLFDMIQPSRYILGMGYDHPEKKWGANLTFTYSKPKNPDELMTSYQGGSGTVNVGASKYSSRAWKTTDVSAYYSPRKNMTLRASVYNVGNYRYVTWEALRQTSSGAVNKHQEGGNYARYAAPGRNVAVSLELKF